MIPENQDKPELPPVVRAAYFAAIRGLWEYCVGPASDDSDIAPLRRARWPAARNALHFCG